jgi:hypothetical protein
MEHLYNSIIYLLVGQKDEDEINSAHFKQVCAIADISVTCLETVVARNDIWSVHCCNLILLGFILEKL